MMKYPSIYKFILIAVLVVGLNSMPTLAKPAQEMLSGIQEALLAAPKNITVDRAKLHAENELLRRMLAESYALNLSLNIKDRKPANSQSLNLDDQISPQNLSSIASLDQNLAVETIGLASISSVPVVYFDNPTYQLAPETELALSSERSYFVSGWSYLLGLYEADTQKLIPFREDNSQLTARLRDMLVPVEVINHFTYRIKLPLGVEYDQGLFEAETGLILGIQIAESTEGNTQFIDYQLPFQPKIHETVSIISLPQSFDNGN